MATQLDLVVWRGKTFSQVVRWEAPPFVYAPISNIAQAAPAVIESTGHGLPDGWRVAVVSVQGMTEINAKNDPLRASDFHKARVVDADTVELNDVNAAGFTPYEGGGYLQYYTPVDMAGYSARMDIKDRVGGTVIASSEAADAPNDVIVITIDNAAKTITVEIPATATEAITAKRGVYDLELVSGSGVVTGLLHGNVEFVDEVTT